MRPACSTGDWGSKTALRLTGGDTKRWPAHSRDPHRYNGDRFAAD